MKAIITMLLFAGLVPQNMSMPETFLAEEEPAAISIASQDKEEILWLARIIYSETKIPEEMELVAWVVRNRVETQYRGETYREVATSKNQFSGLNPGDKQYHVNTSLGYETENASWKQALDIATNVYYAEESNRPLPQDVKHFYSPISVSKAPSWTKDERPYKTIKGENGEIRFAFYQDIK